MFDNFGLDTLTRYPGYGYGLSNALVSNDTSNLPIFDARVMNRAINESGGEATDSSNLGTVFYVFDDMENNDGKVTLPYG